MVDNNENEGGEGAAEAPEKNVESTEASTENEEVQATSEDVEASADDSAEAEETSEEPEKLGVTAELPPVAASPKASVEDVVTAWPVHKDHRSAVDMLVQDAEDVDLTPDPEAGGGGMMNLVLIIAILAAAIGGAWQLSVVSSEEAMELKRAERVALEEAHMAEQLAKQKKYGVLRIESAPEQAVVIKDGEKIMVTFAPAAAVPVDPAAPGAAPGAAPAAEPAKPAADPAKPAADPAAAGTPGEEKPGMTPMNIMNLDIGATYKFRIEKDGYEPFEFAVAEHLWTKDPGSGEYKFFKMIELTPINCEYWFLYDAKKRREVQFKEKGECLTYHDQAVSQQASVTECTCKIPPEGVVPDGGKK